MNEMPQFQPKPMFEDKPVEAAPRRRGRPPKARVQPENETQPKPRKPRQKPARKAAKRRAQKIVEQPASGRPSKEVVKIVGELVEMSSSDRDLVFKLVKAVLK